MGFRPRPRSSSIPDGKRWTAIVYYRKTRVETNREFTARYGRRSPIIAEDRSAAETEARQRFYVERPSCRINRVEIIPFLTYRQRRTDHADE